MHNISDIDHCDFIQYFLKKEKNPELFIEKYKACKVVNDNASKIKFVYFDLETCHETSQSLKDLKTSTIIEIGALYSNELKFSTLCNPGFHITNSQIHGITSDMVKNEVSTFTALKMFIEWLQLFNYDTIVLVAHNGSGFDKQVLKFNVEKFNLTFPQNVVLSDSKYPLIKHLGLKQHSLQFIYRTVFNKDYVEKHRAIEDAKDLQKICNKVMFDKKLTELQFFDSYYYLIF